MANTTIQLKYSTQTATPSSLNVAEPAYSYTSNTLFIGSPAGTGSIAIGGKFYVDQQQIIYDYANAAFTAANSAGSSAFAQGAFNTANASFITANAAFIAANSAGVYANSAFAAANAATATDATQNTSITAAFTAANSAGVYANGAFARANNSLNANTGGTITGSVTITGGDLSVTGNLFVLGNTTTVSSNNVTIDDTLLYIANNNPANLNEIGFVGHFTSGTYQHTGLVRDHTDSKWKLFSNVAEPGQTTVNFANAVYDTLKVGTIEATTTNIGGIDLVTYTTNAYNTANAAFTSANSINGVNTTQNNSITAAFVAANSAGVYANGAFDKANSAYTLATGTAGVANTDYTTITTTAGYYGNGATIASFTLEANGRISQANSTLIGISASQVTVGTLSVARGGTGAGTFTNNGVLLGQGTSALTTASSSTEGHVLTINASGVPTFSHLQGGTF